MCLIPCRILRKLLPHYCNYSPSESSGGTSGGSSSGYVGGGGANSTKNGLTRNEDLSGERLDEGPGDGKGGPRHALLQQHGQKKVKVYILKQ